jgi:uncharacterized membrane protein YcaP (DUF421 family)
MEADEIKLSDWTRILFGEVPPPFFIEIVIRTVFIFLLLIISMRLFGRRMAAQINRIEMVAMFSLAAAIGVPLQAPDRGLLPALIIAIVVILVGRIVANIAFRSERFEAAAEDKLAILASDGVLDMKKILVTRLTVERLFAQLRSEGVRHLGEVKRLYLEANGGFSLIKEVKPSCGLAVLPASDRSFLDEQPQCDEKVCCTCGKKQKDNNGGEVCSNCKNNQWMIAIS